jgi:hypothetical protein
MTTGTVLEGAATWGRPSLMTTGARLPVRAWNDTARECIQAAVAGSCASGRANGVVR